MDNKEALKLFENNQGLVYHVLWNRFPILYQDGDARQEALIGLWRACQTFDPKKGRFSTYAAKCIFNQVAMLCRRRNTHGLVIIPLESYQEDEYGSVTGTLEKPAPVDIENEVMLNDFLSSLTGREKEVVETSLKGYNQVEGCKVLGISQSYYSRVLTRVAKKYLKGEWKHGTVCQGKN